MKKAWLIFTSLLLILFTFCLSSGRAQQYPVKPINLIVGWGAGGGDRRYHPGSFRRGR